MPSDSWTHIILFTNLYLASNSMFHLLQLGRPNRESVIRYSLYENIPGTRVDNPEQLPRGLCVLPGHHGNMRGAIQMQSFREILVFKRGGLMY